MALRVEGSAKGLGPYVPRLVVEWDLDTPGARWRELDATCCFVDISGFTALSERLARRGRVGAEELTEVLNHVFSRMLGIAYDKGGMLLKFGGDALLLAFLGGDHPTCAAQAAVAMRAALREARTLPTSVGRVHLRMSVGMHSGVFHLFRVGSSHHELLVTGPGASATTRMEQLARAGEIVVSEATAAHLPRGAVGDEREGGRLLRWRQVVDGGPGPSQPRDVLDAVVEQTVPAALRTRLAERGESEHRLASVAFVKFQGVDALLASQGPDATALALGSVVGAVQEAAALESVTFLASDIDADGGKIILVAGVPVAQDDDEGRLLRAARRVVERSLPLSVRIGVNRGHVFAGDIGTEFRRTFTVMGDTVNLAARVMAAAPPGSVFATGGVLDHAHVAFDTEALEPFMVKGKSEPVQAYRVGPSTGLKSTAHGSLPFRGRDKELALLLDAFDRARGGGGSVVVVEAERGAGKSRLVAELVGALPEGTATLVLQGHSHGAGVPYWPLQEPMRRLLGIDADDRRSVGHRLLALVQQLDPGLVPLVPLLAPVVDAELRETPESEAVAPEFVRQRVAGLVADVLALACPGPLLIVAEDAHWFDDTTSGICARLADTALGQAWLMCVARRPQPAGFDPTHPDKRMTLEPLLEDVARDLVESATEGAPLRPHERDGVVARAGGNPLFLEELVRVVRDTGVDALPDTLDSVAMREIDALPAVPRRVLRLASVLGQQFDVKLLSRLLEAQGVEVDDDPCRGLGAQLAVDDDGQVRFRHAVLHDAAYQSLPFRTRIGLHLQVAEVLARSARDPDEAAPMLSYHFLAGQDWKQTWKYARMAALVAQRDHALAEVAIHLGRAVTASRHIVSVDADELAVVFADLGWTLEVLGEYERADNAYRQSCLALPADPLARARMAQRRAFIRSEYQGRPSAAIRHLRAGIAILGNAGLDCAEAKQIRALLLAHEADVRLRQGRFAEAERSSRRAIDEAERVDNKMALAAALYVLDSSLMYTGRAAEATHLERVLELYQELGHHVYAALTLNNLGNHAYWASRWDVAPDYYSRASAASTAVGNLANAAMADMNLGEILVNQGHLDDAEALLARARRTMESFGYQFMAGWAAMQLGRVRAFLGDLEAGIALERSAISLLDDAGSRLEAVEARAHLAEILVFGGRLVEANAALEDARALEPLLGETPVSALIDRVALTLAAQSPDASSVAARFGDAVESARRRGALYDLLVMLALAEQLGIGEWDGEATALRHQLGVVTLAMLSEP